MTRACQRTACGTVLVEITWLALLLMVPLVYVVLAVFAVQKAAFAVSAASRAAGRAYSLAPSQAAGVARARAAARIALGDQGLSLAGSRLRLACSPRPAQCLSPGSTIHVDLRYAVRLPLVPSALGGGQPTIRVESSHDVPYGDYREARP